ncbi:TPA: LysM peptidoglycan-binding domain-containing protein [Citrobacter koseri]|nr:MULTISPECIES: LysM domain-containing protein [Citrobacter]EKX8766051.1 LysM peptidoglycan-binding domain-containing protein [Citrobacter koseri]ELJ2663076.1 LysM peptidoglycan-binding domain-containing protein [Citrobacter koseri]MBJ8805100.1 LysM peptidoglycan-binding domain-containing protein [Citrobacter koseri]MBJ8936833.1 LysM peptidoglycan-binding domain-containing protein [Citrobacter koseri]MBJ9108342.1 LysM peptidoglycan-binding domain-containing protein [Citrobacter koseri]
MNIILTVVLLAIFQILILSKANGSSDDIPPLRLNAPFSSQKSIDRLFIEYKDLPKSMRPYLSKILYIKYTFEPVSSCTYKAPSLCNPKKTSQKHYIVKRNIGLDLSQLESAIKMALKANEKDACSDLKFSPLRRISYNNIQMIFKFDLKAHKRACGSTFGVDWSYDLATASGYGIIYVNLNISAPDLNNGTSKGTIGVDIPTIVPTIDNRSLLGFIDANSVAGQIFEYFVIHTGLAIDDLHLGAFDIGFRDLSSEIQKENLSIGITYSKLSEINNIDSVPKFYDDFENLGLIKDYFIEKNTSAFNEQMSLNISSFTMVPATEIRTFYSIKDSELKYIESLGADNIEHNVIRGESLWSLSKSYYGTGELMYSLAELNNITKSKMIIKPNQKIVIPPLYTLSEIRKKYILPGDSLWSFWKENCPKTSWSIFKKTKIAGSSSNDRIYPLQIVNGCNAN